MVLRSIGALGAAIFAASHAAWAGNWPQFRGDRHNYAADVAGLPQEWSAEKNIRWATPVDGRGWASPVVWGKRVFISTAIQEVEGQDTAPPPNYRSGRVGKDSVYRWEVHCLDLESGARLWKQVAFRGNPRVRTHPQNTYASETPATDGERVYAYFGMIGLYCYDVDGEFVWHRDLGGYPMLGDWGTGSSPILHEGLLYLQIDNEESSFLTALDAATGEDRWRADRGRGSSWSTPMIWRNRTRTELVTNGDGVRSYDPDTGELLWSLEYPGGRASASPVGDADMLFVGNERRSDGGGGLFAIRAGASGDITPAPGASTSDGVLWSQTDGGPEFASPLLYQGHLYIFGRSRSSVGCYDAKSGLPVEGLERLPGARPFWSSPWGHGDKVFGTDESGTTFVLGAAPALELLATFDIGEEVRSSPAILGDTIILRGVDHVFCIAE